MTTDRTTRMGAIELDGGDAIECYQAMPDGPPRGGVLVIHEIWGLQDQTRTIADRLADEGHAVFAPDVLSRIGVDPVAGADLERLRFHATDEERTREQPRLRELFSAAYAPDYTAWSVGALQRTLDALAAVTGVGDRLAVVGFCFGGGLAFQLAAADPRVLAAVPFYGRGPDRRTLARIHAPVLAFYGADDEPLMGDLPRLTAEAEAAGVDFDPVVYPGAKHAFFNDLNPIVYDRDAAEDAGTRMHAFIERAFATD